MSTFFKYFAVCRDSHGGEYQSLCTQRAITIGQVRTRMFTFFYILLQSRFALRGVNRRLVILDRINCF